MPWAEPTPQRILKSKHLICEEDAMTYRNDHDAALARIDSLEQELEAMQAVPKPPVMPVKRYAWKIGIIATTAAIGMAAAWVGDRAHTRSPLPASEPAVAKPIFAS